MSEVRAIGDRTNNAQLMRDCWLLGYLPRGVQLDMTYGTGRFWKDYRSDLLITNDLYTTADFHYDFTALPVHWAENFVAVIFDPPYKLNGTGGSHPSDGSYGVANSGKNRMTPIYDGVAEGARVLAPGGYLLVKCQDQVVSGKKVWQTFGVKTAGEANDLTLVDQLHVQSYRPQPAGRRQLHSRGDYSTLLVFRKGTR